jgi:hypothetical protein
MLLDFDSNVNSGCCNHDREEVVAIDMSGKIEESDEDDCKVTLEATSAAGGDGVALLHHATMAATAVEYVGGGCCCAF